ncbi:MAG: penicillin acylase family protein [Bacteroidales bacterium]|nr:penicillin acylase family protein [Bacteroidales bacterium]
MGPYPLAGSYHTVAAYGHAYGNAFKINFGPSHRSIYDLSNWDNSVSVIPMGNSGIAASEFYSNQTEAFVSNRYRRQWFSANLVKENAKYKFMLLP